jgi:hypothetical protein
LADTGIAKRDNDNTNANANVSEATRFFIDIKPPYKLKQINAAMSRIHRSI